MPGQGMPGAPPWGAAAAQLAAMGRGLGAQAWGDPGQGAPTIQNPSANRGPLPTVQNAQNAQNTQQQAAQYAGGLTPQQPEKDPRLMR
jgi:hypothetical protein